MKPAQSKMARAALDWSIRDTAPKAGVSINTLSRFENGGGAYQRTVEKLRTAYEAAGVRFTENGCVCPPGRE